MEQGCGVGTEGYSFRAKPQVTEDMFAILIFPKNSKEGLTTSPLTLPPPPSLPAFLATTPRNLYPLLLL